MNRVRREADVELGLNNTKPADVRVSNMIDEENRIGFTGAMSPQKPPSNNEFLNAEVARGEDTDITGNKGSNGNPKRHPPLAEPESTDGLSEPATPLPARLPHRPDPFPFTETEKTADATDSVDSGNHNHTSDHDHSDEADDLLKTEGAEGGYDEPDIPGENGNNEVHDPFNRAHWSPAPTIVGTIPDVNTYQQKKNLAQGMMDLALLSANANQLRYVLESSTSHPYYYPSVVLIALSILLQVLVGIGLILNSRYNVKDESDICKADKINNMTVLGVFLITLVNVFITSFSVGAPTSETATVVRAT